MRFNLSEVLAGTVFYLCFIYWEYTISLVFIIVLIQVLLSTNKKAVPKVVAPYREPDPEAMARQRAAEATAVEEERRTVRTARKHTVGQLVIGVAIGMAAGSGLALGQYWNAREVIPLDEPTPQVPFPRHEHERPCQCREVVLVILEYETEPRGSSFGLGPHLVLREVIIADLVATVCQQR